MIKVYFEGEYILDDYIIALQNKATLFNDKFELGCTVARNIELEVLRDGVTNNPLTVTFTDENNNPLYYMYVDSVDDADYTYFHYTLMDSMVLMNATVDLSACTTVNEAMHVLMTTFSLAGVNGIPSNIANLEFVWDGYASAREVVGWVAEACGGYAYIDASNNLTFKAFDATPVAQVDEESCSDIRVGSEHNITRVVCDNGIVHCEAGTDTGETVYLNPDNVLFNDNSSMSIQSLVDYISGFVIGLDIFNIEVGQCEVANAIVGDVIEIAGYKTICQEDYTYNGVWTGGYSLDIATNEQEETKVTNSALEKATHTINTRIDRQQGTLDIISAEVNGIDDKLIHFQVNSNDVRISREDTENFSSYTSFKDDGMRIYVEGEQVAEATATIFECNKGLGVQDWAIAQPNSDPNVLCFYRRIGV